MIERHKAVYSDFLTKNDEYEVLRLKWNELVTPKTLSFAELIGNQEIEAMVRPSPPTLPAEYKGLYYSNEILDGRVVKPKKGSGGAGKLTIG